MSDGNYKYVYLYISFTKPRSLLVSDHACCGCGYVVLKSILFVELEKCLLNTRDHTTRPIDIFQYDNRLQASFAALKLDTSSVPNNNHKTVF